MLDGIDIKNELDNENELKLQLEEIRSKINSLKEEEKNIKEQLLKIKKQKDIENGFDKTLVDFYNKKIPTNNNDDYMSWCISEKGLILFEKYIDFNYWVRGESGSFTQSLNDSIFDYIEENELNVREDIILSFIKKEMKSFDNLTIDEKNIINDYMEIVNNIKSDNFKYDW